MFRIVASIIVIACIAIVAYLANKDGEQQPVQPAASAPAQSGGSSKQFDF